MPRKGLMCFALPIDVASVDGWLFIDAVLACSHTAQAYVTNASFEEGLVRVFRYIDVGGEGGHR